MEAGTAEARITELERAFSQIPAGIINHWDEMCDQINAIKKTTTDMQKKISDQEEKLSAKAYSNHESLRTRFTDDLKVLNDKIKGIRINIPEPGERGETLERGEKVEGYAL